MNELGRKWITIGNVLVNSKEETTNDLLATKLRTILMTKGDNKFDIPTPDHPWFKGNLDLVTLIFKHEASSQILKLDCTDQW